MALQRQQQFFLVMMAMVVAIVMAIAWVGKAIVDSRAAPNIDLKVVASDERAVPFFDLVFEYETVRDAWSFADPILRRRGRRLLPADRATNIGPHDLLGFRNRAIPSHPDVVVLGDSQTYGINVDVDSNWPSIFSSLSNLQVYNMSLPSWSALSYRYMIDKALEFDPSLIVVALYMGNDALENTMLAYSTAHWQDYRPRPELELSDLDTTIRAGGVVEHFLVSREPELTMPFQVANRYDANDASRAMTSLGYEIQNRAVREIIEIAKQSNAPIAFLVVPTKESLYAEHLLKLGAELGDEYRTLIENERKFQSELTDTIRRAGALAIDVAQPLRASIEAGELPYPLDGDGHPTSRGYAVIAQRVLEVLTAGGKEAILPPDARARLSRLPGASSSSPIARSDFLETLDRLGFTSTSAESSSTIEGYVDVLVRQPGSSTARLRGWAFDRVDPSARTAIAVVLDGAVELVGQTDTRRSDVERAFGLTDADDPVNAFDLELEGTCTSVATSEIEIIAISEASHAYRSLPAVAMFKRDCG